MHEITASLFLTTLLKFPYEINIMGCSILKWDVSSTSNSSIAAYLDGQTLIYHIIPYTNYQSVEVTRTIVVFVLHVHSVICAICQHYYRLHMKTPHILWVCYTHNKQQYN